MKWLMIIILVCVVATVTLILLFGKNSETLPEECELTCHSQGLDCGNHYICSEIVNCGTCTGDLTCVQGICKPDSESLGGDDDTPPSDDDSSVENDDSSVIVSGGGSSGGGSSGGSSGGTSCADTCSSLNYNCGTHDICGSSMSCGTCDAGFICSSGVCLEIPQGLPDHLPPENVYFVAVDGDDANPGTFEEPWATFQYAIYRAKPGDTVYFRGGVYLHDDSVTSSPTADEGSSGTPDAWIKFWNYPGERPIFDFADHGVDPLTGWTGSIGFYKTEYIHLRGFTVRNVFTVPPDFSRENKPYSEGHGLGCASCGSMIYENLVVHNIDGRAYQHWSGAWSEADAEYGIEWCLDRAERGIGDASNCVYQEPIFEKDNTKYINCDAHSLYDRYDDTPGNAADGWKVGTYFNDGKNSVTWEGCRAWNYSDDGIDPHGAGYRIMRNNWMWPTLNFDGLSPDWDPESNGYKTTGITYFDHDPDIHYVIHDRNIAANGDGSGFIPNIQMRCDSSLPSNPLMYNNFAYKMNIGFVDNNCGGYLNQSPATSTYINNIAYDAQSTDAAGRVYEIAMWYMCIFDKTNSWIKGENSFGEGCSGWSYNPNFNVTNEDFVSLDYSELASPRRSDFTLPDIDFGKLRADSDLIDAGTWIEGHHCDTPGRHPDQNCVEWAGLAPDLGPFEFGLGEEPIVCRGETSRYCSWENGVGVQERTCIGPGEWSIFGACQLYECDDGYMPDGDTCVIEVDEWSEELLYNGGFETSALGWTSTANWQASEYVAWNPPHEGYYNGYNNGKSNETTFIYQDVDLTDYVSYIDDGRLLASASGWARNGYASAIKFVFLDENRNEISTPYDSGYVEISEWWEGSMTEEPVPAGTRFIRAWGNTYHPFTNTAGSLDDFSVKVKVTS